MYKIPLCSFKKRVTNIDGRLWVLKTYLQKVDQSLVLQSNALTNLISLQHSLEKEMTSHHLNLAIFLRHSFAMRPQGYPYSLVSITRHSKFFLHKYIKTQPYTSTNKLLLKKFAFTHKCADISRNDSVMRNNLISIGK